MDKDVALLIISFAFGLGAMIFVGCGAYLIAANVVQGLSRSWHDGQQNRKP